MSGSAQQLDHSSNAPTRQISGEAIARGRSSNRHTALVGAKGRPDICGLMMRSDGKPTVISEIY